MDRVTAITIRNLRALRTLNLSLDGLTVLVGENGSGKSTVVEALEILRKAGSQAVLLDSQFRHIHGEHSELVRQGKDSFTLGLTLRTANSTDTYEFSVGAERGQPVITHEKLEVQGDGYVGPLHALERWKNGTVKIFDVRTKNIETIADPDSLVPPTTLALSSMGVQAQPAIKRMLAALRGISVGVPFDTHPRWVKHEVGGPFGPRSPQKKDDIALLDRTGANLTNCLFRLKSDKDLWPGVLEDIRLGLGSDVVDLDFSFPAEGYIEMRVGFASLPKPVAAAFLSEGQLSYLAFIALMHLSRSQHSLVAFDEPECHFHPSLIARIAWMFEALGEHCPVLLSTHSDRLLDALSDPVASVVLCELDEHRITRFRRPDASLIGPWLQRFRGLGELRSAGFEAQVFKDVKEQGAGQP